MIKVFTKYDLIIPKIMIPQIREIEPSVIMGNTPLYQEGSIYYDKEHCISHVEKGLEGVVFVHYKPVTQPLS